MKKLIFVAGILVMNLSVLAQGTLLFQNRATAATPPIDAKIFNVGGTAALGGTGFMAILYAGATATSLAAVGPAVPFRTGAAAGYVDLSGDPTAGTRILPGVVAGANAFAQVRAWDISSGATYDVASIRGESAILNIPTGGAGSPPGLPANLTGLQSFSLVPEPSTIALAALGAAFLILRRRK